MKQRISPEQLQELTEEQAQKLRDWWKPERADVFFTEGRRFTVFSSTEDMLINYGKMSEKSKKIKKQKAKSLPLLTLGQLQQFIYETEGWPRLRAELNHIITQHGPESLVDELWRVVKDLL